MYQKHAKQTLDKLYFWDDLQEVIMLPPMDSFREAVFTIEIVEFSKIFVTLGTLAKPKRLTELGFEAISGRIKEDTLNYTHAFFCWIPNIFAFGFKVTS